MKKIIFLYLFIFALLLSSCLPQTNQQTTTNNSQITTYTLEQVGEHNSADDCWMVLSNKVYDLTNYIAKNSHPGGKAILEGCGKDATDLFETRPMGSGTPHSDKARAAHDQYYIGELK